MNYEEVLNEIKQAERDGLEELYLSSIQSKALPPEIGQLAKLRELRITDSQLTTLPPEIGQLTNLTTLDISRNKLESLPREIRQLAKLKYFKLWSNKLNVFPQEITELLSLEVLEVDDTELKELPPEIGRLTNLKYLEASYNRITALPEELSRLTMLERLDLKENPLPIPPEILTKRNEPAAILNYYFSHRAGRKKPLNEAKVLVLGQGSVGKTSLVRRLTEGKFDPRENKTEGIDIRQWQLEVGGDDIRLNVWDFGGQEIMHATHQFFLTKRSLYVLVLDARLGQEENRVEYWLKMIESFGGDSPVIVVGNKTDQQPLDIDRRGLQLKYKNIRAIVETSCRDERGIDELKSAIAKEIGTLPHIHDQLLVNWFAVKTRLEEMEQDFIPYHEYVRLCEDENVSDETSQQTLIRFLHDLGIVLNFRDDPRLEETNILNPEWVTNGVYKILNWHELFQSKGVLERKSLSRILDPRQYPKEKHLFIMDMMRKFELCYDFEGFANEKFLIPDLLSKEEPYTGEWEGALAFQYHYNVLPGSIISRFIVRMHPYIYRNTSWRAGVVLEHEGNKALVKADIEDRRIFIWLDGPEHTRRAFLAIIRNHFDSIHKTIPGIVADEKVPLPERPEIVVDYKHLLNLEAMGEQNLIPEGLMRRVNVRALLSGVETEQSRRERREGWRTLDRPHQPPIAPAEWVDDERALRELIKIKTSLDLSSERQARRSFWLYVVVLLVVWAGLGLLTYSFGWGALEQWTFFIVGGGVTVGSYAYFALTRNEFSPKAMYTQLVEAKKKRAYLDSGFDLEKYERLTRSKQ